MCIHTGIWERQAGWWQMNINKQQLSKMSSLSGNGWIPCR
ncbi:hypothetical protein E2C01_093195 [Portunus trituberculatus]|uniref:Uncharacterized protein n=1 Tax=Portunus trituberculatus TaxID=210409 RepID=A0A5B7JXZ0_PORTR|nr:hypothetical protein [Portunus trituberculatus]